MHTHTRAYAHACIYAHTHTCACLCALTRGHSHTHTLAPAPPTSVQVCKQPTSDGPVRPTNAIRTVSNCSSGSQKTASGGVCGGGGACMCVHSYMHQTLCNIHTDLLLGSVTSRWLVCRRAVVGLTVADCDVALQCLGGLRML